jgi:hypothetical protein
MGQVERQLKDKRKQISDKEIILRKALSSLETLKTELSSLEVRLSEILGDKENSWILDQKKYDQN